jgi:hypothetical protein
MSETVVYYISISADSFVSVVIQIQGRVFIELSTLKCGSFRLRNKTFLKWRVSVRSFRSGDVAQLLTTKW